ncbi:DNA cytosine methyltransferase [Marinimicrobium sp. C6131]|uniref:DNA cytosine methyltransferase n=1 Tax=Marinimicrobium sp. C6131 TaxID=3022676 RepID=UPI00223D9836|nr:DNA cytosine methyltransferase [Marinimicrobium sp. C6131]UZJ44237.1 DNA cytosine methyltransferase [Marinimicrobium sp. C6131]
MNKPIKVIDLFAGPGGLGEGFSAFRYKGKSRFKISISIEKDESAHRTLQLRALYRQYPDGKAPDSYYAFLRGELGKNPEDELYRLPELQDALCEAKQEAQKIELGVDSAKLTYAKIREALDGDECILIGGPPCQAYSLVGRARNYGAKDKAYSAVADNRNFLYKEYLKVIAKFQPMVFVMENVKGMLSAKVDGKLIFETIYKDLHNPCSSANIPPDSGKERHKYRIYSFVTGDYGIDFFDSHELEPKDFVIKAENYGIPQKRHRVILLGVREDLRPSLGEDFILKSSPRKATVEQVISDLPKLRSRISKGEDSFQSWKNAIRDLERPALDRIKLDKQVPKEAFELFFQNFKGLDQSPASTGGVTGQKRNGFHREMSPSLRQWYEDKKMGRYITNHESRGHIVSDLHRYLYYSTYAKVMLESPKSNNLPKELWPNHKNFGSGKFADRFRVQVGGEPGSTVTSHISKDGHYFIHYDPSQCRSLTVREAARIQTFPDNYFFVGNRTQQYVQVGNAVPPLLAKQLAEVVWRLLS